jgi:hypothetical protein
MRAEYFPIDLLRLWRLGSAPGDGRLQEYLALWSFDICACFAFSQRERTMKSGRRGRTTAASTVGGISGRLVNMTGARLSACWRGEGRCAYERLITVMTLGRIPAPRETERLPEQPHANGWLFQLYRFENAIWA